VDKFTDDRIMAVFGAPVALEDQAFRACLAALGVHHQAKRLAVEVQEPEGVELRLRAPRRWLSTAAHGVKTSKLINAYLTPSNVGQRPTSIRTRGMKF
jgi:class 3 adenylate cyclase